jgi:SAM-dependent methyltransferase
MHEESKKLYESLLKEFGHSPQAVNWKNREAQYIRFEQLAKIVNTGLPFSINDLGCGLGDFGSYLAQMGRDFIYNGYDIVPGMIEGAKQKFGNRGSNISFDLINDAADMKTADYTVESGIFNRRFDQTEGSYLSYILKTLQVMNEKSRLGFAFNALTKYSDKELMKEDLYYADPCFLFDYCKVNFSRNVALLHDYNLYDFTILVRKNPS